MANEIIPFGKYKGQPDEALVADRGYLEWLAAANRGVGSGLAGPPHRPALPTITLTAGEGKPR
jgi:hypothetical protein